MLVLILTCGWAISTVCSVPFGRMPALTRSISVSRHLYGLDLAAKGVAGSGYSQIWLQAVKQRTARLLKHSLPHRIA